MKERLLAALEAQGARCGHIDGRARCGVYVMGEEGLYATTAAIENTLARKREWSSMACIEAWARGYRAGYRVGADGMDLDPETVDHELPEACA